MYFKYGEIISSVVGIDRGSGCSPVQTDSMGNYPALGGAYPKPGAGPWCSVPVDWGVGWSFLNLGWVGIEAALIICIIYVLCVHGTAA